MAKKALLSFMGDYKILYVALLFTVLATAAAETATVAMLFPIANTMLDAGQSGGVVLSKLDDVVAMVPVSDPFLGALVLLGVVVFAKVSFRMLRRWLVAHSSAKVTYETKKKVFARYSDAPYQFFLESEEGDLIYRLTRGPQSLATALRFLPEICASGLTVLLILGLLASMNWKVTLGIVILGAAFYGLNRIVSQRISYRAGQGKVEASSEEVGTVTEFVEGVREIKTGQATGWWEKRVDDPRGRYRDFVVQDITWAAVPGVVMEFFLYGGIVVGAGLVWWLAGDSAASLLPLLGTFAFGAHRLIGRVNGISGQSLRLVAQLHDIELLHRALHEPLPDVPEGDRTDVRFGDGIEFDDVTFIYPGREERALDAVNFEIPRDEVTAIVGRSGAGKSTTVNLLLRLFEPTDGAIRVDGSDLADFTLDAWRSQIGYVAQDTFIFNGTVEENIRFGDEDASDDDLVAAARAAHAHEFIQDLPDGYDTIVGDRGKTLSGGQRQRLAIARSLLRDPELLIFDEATSNLDVESETIIQQAIQELSGEMTTLIIAHRLSTTEIADTIVVLEDGKVIEKGTREELFTGGSRYREIVAG